MDELRKLDTFPRFAALLAECDRRLSVIATPGAKIIIQGPEALLLAWLQALEQLRDSGTSRAEAIDIVLNQIDELLTTETANCEIYTPVKGLAVPNDFEGQVFSRTLVLRRVSDAEIIRICSGDAHVMSQMPGLLPTVQAAFVTTLPCRVTIDDGFDREPIDPEFFTSAYQVSEWGIIALHLVKAGRFGAYANYLSYLPSVFPFMRGHIQFPSDSDQLPTIPLSHDEIRQAAEQYRGLERTPLKELRLAVSRLREAENRRSDVDALLDAFIGIETLLNPAGNDELSFRISVAYSFLGAAPERKARFDKLKRLYGVRSKAVHGAIRETPEERAKIASAARESRECLREVCLALLTRDEFRALERLDSQLWTDRLFSL